MSDEKFLSQMEMDCDYWTKRLRLQDWSIHIKITPELPSVARISIFAMDKTAVIRMRPCFTYKDGGCLDFEVSLVHELLHLHGAGFDKILLTNRNKNAGEAPTSEVEHDAYEAMVELTAQALVGVRRGQDIPSFPPIASWTGVSA